MAPGLISLAALPVWANPPSCDPNLSKPLFTYLTLLEEANLPHFDFKNGESAAVASYRTMISDQTIDVAPEKHLWKALQNLRVLRNRLLEILREESKAEYEHQKRVEAETHPETHAMEALFAKLISKFQETYFAPEFKHRLIKSSVEGDSYFIATKERLDPEKEWRIDFEFEKKPMKIVFPAGKKSLFYENESYPTHLLTYQELPNQGSAPWIYQVKIQKTKPNDFDGMAPGSF